MFRFIHTSDIHLDTSFSGAGFPSNLGNRKREAIRGTFRRIVEDVRRENADLLLIAGDLFESERVTPDTVEFLKQQFEKIHPVGVFIAPGNHDPCVSGSPYTEVSWPENVRIFDREEFHSVELPGTGICVTGYGFESSTQEKRHFTGLPILENECFNIVLSHGSDMGRVPSGKSKHGPFTVEEIAGKNVQYCALGHYHEQHRIPNPIDETQIWYSGIPEGRGWDETGKRGYLFCEFSGGNLKVESRPCCQYILTSLTIDCDSFTTREQILDAVMENRGTVFDSDTILKIRLEGAPDPGLDLSIPELDERLAGEALYIQWYDNTYPSWDFDSIAREKTLRGRFVRDMNERIGAISEGLNGAHEEKIRLERARLYGVQALSGNEVRLR